MPTPTWERTSCRRRSELCVVFADIRSPNTVRNLRANPAIEINVVDATLRKGYRFKGTGTVLAEGPQFEEILRFYREAGLANPIHHIVLVKVEHAEPLLSPAYDLGQTEAEVAVHWDHHWEELRRARIPRTVDGMK